MQKTFSLPVRALACALVLCAGTESGAKEPFPADGLQPKAEIGADRFLTEHPAYDGRGVVVAIFDTGVDPGAPGLQTTTDGKPKIIDLVDGSGSGDVDTSTVRKAKNGVIEGRGGRELKIGDALRCPKNEWHVGTKRAYAFFPRGLIKRLTKKRRESFDEAQREAEARLVQALAASKSGPEAGKLRRQKELTIRLRQLRALAKGYADPGPNYDCVVFHDGSTWRAVIDTDEDGNLGDEKALAAFREERQYGTFSKEDRLNYGINVYDDGNLLSIVADCGAHGTHVAGMVAAHVPGKPELNGVAPGAQIVAVKIGDPRAGTSSMGTGSERGLVAVQRNRCDLINMSYGGPGVYPNRGYVEALYDEIVNKHGAIFVASAGNEGPALTTVGGPGGTSSALIGVGAYVSPAMMKAQHGLRKTLPPIHYTWSSRGPTSDGDLGVDLSAPGGAVAPVPNWKLQGQTHMTGTSMSSPSLCGGVALLLSGLRAEKETWTPIQVKRALVSTARKVEGIEIFAMGHGLLQVPEAFEHLKRWGTRAQASDARFEIRLPDRGGARGIYLREPYETDRPVETRVRIKPRFHEDEDHQTRIDLSMRVALESTVPWVETGSHFMLHHGGETLRVRVDPTQVAPGTVAYAEIRGFDAEDRERGPLFRVPVTVVRPTAPPADDGRAWRESLRFEPGGIERRFFAVPAGATWADLRIRTQKQDTARLLVVHAQQLLPGRHFKEGNFEGWFRMGREAEVVRSFKVTGRRTLEICFAQYWSSLGVGAFDAELTFRGLQPSSEVVRVDGAKLLTRVDVTAPIRDERIAPKARLTTLRKRIRPAKTELRALDPARDMLSDKRRIHEMVVTYEFELAEDAKIKPIAFNAEDDDFGEEWSSNLWQVFDENKRQVGQGPLWNDAKLSLGKGRYTLRLHLRQIRAARLEAVRDAALYLDVTLGNPLPLRVHADALAAVRGGKPFEARLVQRGERVRLYLASPPVGKLPKSAGPGDELRGEIQYGEEDAKRLGTGHRPGGYPLWYVVPPKASRKKDAEEKADAPAKPTLQRVDDAVLELEVEKLAALRKAKAFDAFDQLAARILARRAGHVPVLLAQLARVDGKGPPHADDGRLTRVLAAADRVLARIDRKRLAAHFGRKHESKKPEAKALDARMTERRDALREALFRKSRALAAGGPKRRPAFIEAFTDLRAWADTDTGRYVSLSVAFEQAHDRPGAALQLLQASMKKGRTKRKAHELRARLYEELGWNHWAAHERAWMAVRFPSSYPPF